jgi:acetyltransferase-like isoleucine patch superfamily enzyme
MTMFDAATDPKLRAEILARVASETMTDRERARFFGLPEGCRMREHAKILCPEKLTIGRNCYIGEGVILDAQGGLTIGDNCQFGSYTLIWTHSSHEQARAGETGTSRARIQYKPTAIGSNCFIAGPAVVAMGVTIGDGVMVMPMSLVDRDVPDGAVVSTSRELRQLERRLAALERRLAPTP